MKRVIVAAGVLALLAGCLCREGNLDNIETAPHEWDLPGPEEEIKVFGPIPVEEVKAYIEAMQYDGWELVGCSPASESEEIMVNKRELEQPAPPDQEVTPVKERGWPHGIPRTMKVKDSFKAPAPKMLRDGSGTVDSIPSYLDEGVRAHRQKYLLVMRRWL